jgi:hypothetical protein
MLFIIYLLTLFCFEIDLYSIKVFLVLSLLSVEGLKTLILSGSTLLAFQGVDYVYDTVARIFCPLNA